MAQVDQRVSQQQSERLLRSTPSPSHVPVRATAPRQWLYGPLAIVGSCLLVTVIALLDWWTGPFLDFGIFYLLPVMICAWWCGFPAGLLLALLGTFAWNYVESGEQPFMPQPCTLWNGVTRFGTLTLVASLVARLRTGIIREQRLARTDALTGAANGRTFYERTEEEAKRASRSAQPLTLAYIDLDNFKQLNDRMGHAVGDEALISVVMLIHANLRQSDVLARLGGDEFALLLPETGPVGATALLTRLQGVVAQEMTRKDWPLSMSIGAITFIRPHGEVDRMIQKVDGLMYLAKKKGKGRIEHQVVDVAAKVKKAANESRSNRRAMARLLCNSSARVHCEMDDGHCEKYAVVRDISPGGVGLQLEEQLPLNTVIVVEPLSSGARTLLARVVRVEREDSRWLHGCILSVRLGKEELRAWQGDK